MKLKKELNLVDVFCLATGAMVSSGLFILPGLAHALAGPAVVLSYLVAGLLAVPGMFSIVEMATAMPKAGGDYFFVTRSVGPAVGTVSGLLSWFSLSLKSAFALVGMSAFTVLLVDVDMRLVAAGLCVCFVLVNLAGAKEATRFQILLVFGLLALMTVYVVLGFPRVSIRYFEPFAPRGIAAVLSTAGFVFVSFGGLLNVASVAEEIKNPTRVIPLGMVLSLSVICVFYTLMVFVTSGVVGAEKLDFSLTPISDGAAVFMGAPGRVAMSVAAVLAFVSTANAGILSASRYLLALSRDELMPAFVGRVSRRFQTPHVAVTLTGAFMIAVLLLDLKVLVEAASTVVILNNILSNLSVVILRESRLLNYRPAFPSPLYPWMQVAGIAGCTLLIFEMGQQALLISLLLVAGGLFIYWFYGRIKANREYALLHIVERVSAKELSEGMLESELKDIVRERDEWCMDRFDRIIEKTMFLDLEEGMKAEDFFGRMAEEISEVLRVPWEALFRLFMKRESQGSPMILPGVVVSDIVVEGEDLFDVFVIRCREGIEFPGADSKAHMVFLLVGTPNERNLHLHALMSIAQIIQDPSMEEKWLEAKSAEALRDLILLGERRRIC